MKRPAAVTPEGRPRKARVSSPSPLMAQSDDALFGVHIGVPPLDFPGLRAQLRDGEASIAIAALRGLYKELSVWKEDAKVYARCYHRTRKTDVLFGLFNAVHILHRRTEGALSESTGKHYAFVVVLEGSVVLSVDNKDGQVQPPGNILFVATRSWHVGARGTGGATVAVAFLEPVEGRSNRKHLEKMLRELADSQAQVKEPRLQRRPSEVATAGAVVHADSARDGQVALAGAVVDAAAGAVAAVAAKSGGEKCEWTGAQSSVCVGRPPVTRVALKLGMRTRWPEHRGVLLHRFYLSEKTAPLKQWRELLLTWPPSFLQYVWTYSEAEFEEIAGEVSNAVRMDASRLLSAEVFGSLRRAGHPIPLLKDLIQFKALHAFGGWFADLDFAYLRDGGMWHAPLVWAELHAGRSQAGRGKSLRLVLPGEAGFSSDGEVNALFFAEPERQGDGYEKGDDKVMVHGGQRMAVNFGLAWGRAGAVIFRGVVGRLEQNTRDQREAWTRDAVPANKRMDSHWLQNQVDVQHILRGRPDVRIAPPRFAFPLPRFLRRLPTACVAINGAAVQPPALATAAASALCLWSGVWKQELAAAVLEQAKVAASEEKLAERSVGAAVGAAVPECGSRGGSCASGSAADPGGGSRGGSCGPGQAGREQLEAAAADEEAFAETLSILHHRAFALLAEGGADLVLAHLCISSAIGFASSCWSAAWSRLHLSAPAMAYGCLCMAAKLHWLKDTGANGLACQAFLWESWGEALQIAIGDRQGVRQRCEAACLVAGFSS